MTTAEVKKKIECQIIRSNKSIERHIDNIEISNRGCVSQDVLQDLRTFVQTIMLRLYADDNDVFQVYGNVYKEIRTATNAIKTKVPFLGHFFDYLQAVASHYTLEPENAERVMLKYMEYLIKTKEFVANRLGLHLLNNLEKFPVNTDKNLQKYYQEIARKIDSQKPNSSSVFKARYYIHKIKPFFVDQKIYYEVTFTSANRESSKTDRMIAFTQLDISKYYAVTFWTVTDSINILGRQLSIFIIKKWEVAIRPIEFENLGKIFGVSLKASANSAEGRGLMLYLQETGNSLVNLVTSNDDYYGNIKQMVLTKFKAKSSNIFPVLDRCRQIILNDDPGSNVLRYLLLHLNNEVMKLQIQSGFHVYGRLPSQKGNGLLSNLFLANGCKPFDEMPFASSLIGHNPKLSDLFECIDTNGRQHELLARAVKQNTERTGVLYTPKKDLTNFGDLDKLIEEFNSKLYSGHRPDRELRSIYDYIYVYEDQQATIDTLDILKRFDSQGLEGYANVIKKLLDSREYNIDDKVKREALMKMFTNSRVALIYGSAGTGKTTLINHISSLFNSRSRLYLAQTNPAVDNMKRRVLSKNSNTTFSTITKFLKSASNRVDYDILFVDECSTISNADIQKVLKKAQIRLIVLVGDTYQIKSIRFGNWFSLAKKFLPESVTELVNPFRSSNEDLVLFWNKVRQNADDIQETNVRLQYSENLDQTIFKKSEKDEIILCLNYDGLYGINNINSLLQENNPEKAFYLGLKSYKVKDPVLFNDSKRFSPVIYNNLKGWIRDIKPMQNKVQFDIEIDKALTEFDSMGNDFKLVGEGSNGSNSVIRFTVDVPEHVGENDDDSDSAIVPFQVAYAVSIHKAQGLEYDSVKIVITDEVEEQITHNIFYTAITRARKKLKIYWSPEVNQKILKHFRPNDDNKDFYLLKKFITDTKS